VTVGEVKMKNAVKLISAALTLWLSAESCATSAGLYEGHATYGRSHHVAAARTGKLSAREMRARADAALGFKYEHGLGVPQNYVAAVDLYARAAEQGDTTGQYLLGLMYDKGHGVWPDTVLAHKWLILAAAHAPKRYHEYYLRLRDAVASKMTPSQISESQWLAYEWVPKPGW
jgi:TPR repeat protein